MGAPAPDTVRHSPLSPRERAALRHVTRTRLPLLLVLVSLGLALVVPRLAERRVIRLREEINAVAEPARARLAAIQLDLALEAAARRGYLLTGDRQLAREIATSRTRRHEAERQLEEYARRLDPQVSAELARLTARLQALDAHLDTVVATGVNPSASPAPLAERQEQFDDALAAAGRLQDAIGRSADVRRERIGRTEQTVALLTAGLVLLGLGAALLVARLGSRFRTLALRLDESEERLRQIATAAEQRRLEVERVTESRARLMRGFTHDVKNPLGAAEGYLSLLADGIHGTLADPQREAVERARRSIEHALELIAQLLDLARAEAGQLEFRPHRTDVAAVLRELGEAFRPQAEAKHLALRVEVPELPATWTDATRVRQVLANLVSNAVKYSPTGGHIALSAAARNGETAMRTPALMLRVTDDGPGIPEDRIPMLFAEFTRLDPEAAEGAGIGLAISQRIARALGGEISVESRVGDGSTFTLELPLREPSGQ